MIEHETEIIVQVGPMYAYLPVCKCGWKGIARMNRATAESEADEHRRLAGQADA